MNATEAFAIDDLDGDQREIAEIIGIDNYFKLVKSFGGTTIYIRKLDTLLHGDRNRKIYAKFDGYNYRELALEFNLSERAIRDILNPFVNEVRSRPMNGQVCFDDCGLQ